MSKNKKQNNSPSNAQNKAQQVADSYANKSQIKSDPMGSWTGKPENRADTPVQDADDL